MSKACWICETEITDENDTKEHMIPNAIGGRLKVRGFICKSCNSNAGSNWDAELSKQLHPLSLLFGIQRERGNVAPLSVETTAGEKLIIRLGEPLIPADPEFIETNLPSGQKQYEFKARTMAEARGMIRGLKRKHPNIDTDALVAELKVVETYPEGFFHHKIELGGPIAGRSIVKSCAALAASLEIPVKNCGFAVDYLRDENSFPCFGYYNATELVSERTPGTPMHCLAVRADPGSGLVIGYVEYFGAHRIVVCLGEGYVGQPRAGVYCLDPRTGKELPISVALDFSKSDIEDIYDYKKVSPEGLRTAFDAVVGPVLAKSREKEQRRVLERAVATAFASCGAGEGEMLTTAHLEKISKTLADELTPFILHAIR